MARKISLGSGLKTSLGLGLSGLSIAVLLSAADRAVAQTAAQPAPAESSSSSSPATVAQYYDESELDSSDVRPLPTIPQAFNDAYYSRRGNYFDNRQIWKSFSLIFGIPTYPEQAISRDGRAVNQLYRETLEQQVASDPVLRTPDLPNPYTGSVLTTPLVITEDAVEAAPMFPPIRRPGYVEPAPVAPPSRSPETPIPALW
jgi:hypothetical protein